MSYLALEQNHPGPVPHLKWCASYFPTSTHRHKILECRLKISSMPPHGPIKAKSYFFTRSFGQHCIMYIKPWPVFFTPRATWALLYSGPKQRGLYKGGCFVLSLGNMVEPFQVWHKLN
jgi:hypothetical protein